jgi:hypothetical protein
MSFTIEQCQLMQKFFHEKIHNSADTLTQSEKEEITKTLALCLHQETSALISTINFREHVEKEKVPDLQNLKYEAVDAFRYILAILNTWDITPQEFSNAFYEKDAYLNLRNELSLRKWEGQSVLIVDVDDVLAEFRSGFSNWLREAKKIYASVDSKEYYFITALSEANENPEQIFEEYLAGGGFAALEEVTGAFNALKELRSQGYWIQLLTARPDERLKCLYDTYTWLRNYSDCFDAIDFSTEKFRWCAQSKYYDSGAIKFAIDDSPKHATEYAKHGIKTLVPLKPYNEFLEHENIQFYSHPAEIIKLCSEG